MNDQDKTKEQLIGELAEMRRRIADLERVDGERKRAEEDLRASRLQLAEAADMARIAYWEHDGATDEFIFNDVFYTLYGTTAEQEKGYRMSRDAYLERFVHPDDREELGRQVEANEGRLRTDDIEQYEHRVIRGDGEVIRILNRNRVVMDSEGRVLKVVGVNQDITDRKKAEEQLLIANFGLESAIGATSFADLHGRVTYANDSFIRLWGYERPEEVLGRHISEFSVLGSEEEGIKAVRTGRGYIGEGSAVRKDGSSFRVQVAASVVKTHEGKPICLMASFIDITDRKAAEEALRESEERFRSYFELGLIGMAITSQAKGMVEVNEEFCEMLGYEKDELLQKTWEDLTHPDDRAVDIAQFSRVLAGEIDGYSMDKRFIRKDGRIIDVTISVRCVRRADGSVDYFVALLQDITERKRAERELREYEKAVENSQNLIAIVDPDYRYRLANKTFLTYRGLRKEDVVGRFAVEVLGPDVFEQTFKEHLDRCFQGEVVQHDMRHAYGRHGQRDVSMLCSPVEGLNGIESVLIIERDITERKQAEDALRESETKFRAVFEGSRDAIGVSKNGIRTFMNPAYVSLFGYENADELMGKPVMDLIAPESRGFVAEMVKKHARGEPVPSFYEQTSLKKDGTRFSTEVAVSTYLVKGEEFSLAILRDITERRRAEDEIRLLKHSIDVHYDGAYWMNTDNEFVYVNDAACKALGYEREELIGKKLYLVNPEASAEGMVGVWEDLRRGGSFLGQSVHRRKDGSEFPVEIVTTYVQFGGKEYACGFARDITEKKRLEEQLRQAQKMEAVGTLAGGVAHDFNNILTVIMGFSNLIQATVGKDDLLRPYIDQIVTSSERAADLTQSLLAFSRKQRITPEPHTVNGVVTSTAKLLRRLLPEDIALTMNLADEDNFGLLDVTQIGQVLMNLATNARDAMPHGGSLTITTARVTLDGSFKKIHGFGRPGEYVKLSISDTGTGMDAPTVERIFEPFFTTKEVGRGTGLGLASAYGIVKQHNGYIDVSSRLFKGTTFDIYLPLIASPEEQRVPAAREAKRGVETILIVEDDRDVRNMLARILQSHGYTTMEAVDGGDAIRVHREGKEKIDLVILDVVMPEKNGKEVLDEISRIDPTVKVIFVSGYTGDIVIDRGVQSESVDFLQKPLSVMALLSKVREVLDR